LKRHFVITGCVCPLSSAREVDVEKESYREFIFFSQELEID